MIEIIQFGEPGITRWVENLTQEIENNPAEFISVARITDGGKNYSFAALFKDKCMIGKYSVLLHEWGTNDGTSGEGGSGFIRMNKFLEDNQIEVVDIELERKDAKKIGYTTASKLTYITDWNKRKSIWDKYLRKLISSLL
jgi:hypothetical protein